MSGGRNRFQNHMMRSLNLNAQLLGEDAEEILQFRDLIANTNTKLLIATFVVSFLHMVRARGVWVQCVLASLAVGEEVELQSP